MWNFSFSRYGSKPESLRYSVTTSDPGASDVLTHSGTVSPFSTAFFASNPAPTSTDGFEVLVQLVMAAITTLPCPNASSSPTSTSTAVAVWLSPTFGGCPPSVSQRDSCFGGTCCPGFNKLGKACSNDWAARDKGTRSCGRFGPAMLGSTVARSRSSTSVYSASGAPGVWNRPCSL